MPHIYSKEGTPHFDLKPAQAKKLGYLFSVSEQFGLLAKPGLQAWKENKLAEAAYSAPPMEGESEKDFTRRIKEARYQNTSGPANLGSSIHEQIEEVLQGKPLSSVPPSLLKYVTPAVTYFKDKGFKIDALEKIVVSVEHTFAGTADCIGTTSAGLPFIMDWKSRKTTPGKITPYPENLWQIAAYAVAAYGEDRVVGEEIWGVNCFISTSEVGEDGLARFESHSYEPKAVASGWETAKVLFDLYRRTTGYDPRTIG